MIEVVLAMAIIAFGMTSILGLFPVGLNALKASMAENSCSDAIDQVSGYLKNQAEYSPAKYSEVFTAAGTSLPTDKPTAVNGNPDANTKFFLAAYNTKCDANCLVSGKWCAEHPKQCTGINPGVSPNTACVCALSTAQPFSLAKHPKIFADWNIYQTVAGTSFPSVYFVIQGSTQTKAYDYAAMVMVWKSPVKYNVPNPAGGWFSNVPDNSYVNFAGLNFEISWPLEKPYAEREKRYYYIEVERP